MPLPLIVPLIIAAGGVFGAGKTAKAILDNNEAKDIATNAQSIVDRANKTLDQTKAKTNSLLAEYGKQKLDALDKQVSQFVTLFKRLKNVELADSPELENLKLGKFTEVAVAELQNSCSFAQNALQGVGAGAVGGALTAFGAYSGTMLLASAGTGTAISALSGVAATNATLAWLGGGTLAAGGLGIAGGTMVLGAMVAGPALLIFGSILGAKASQRLSEAKENLEHARTFDVQVEGVCQKLKYIQSVTTTASSVLSTLRSRLRRANGSLQNVIDTHGEDFSQYDADAKATVFKCVKYAQLVKLVIDTPILNENGEALESSLTVFNDVNRKVLQ